MKTRGKKILAVLTAMVIVLTLVVTPAVALSGNFGGGNNYGTTLSYSSASTITAFASGYSGTAAVSAIAYYFQPGNPNNTSNSGTKSNSNSGSSFATTSVSLSPTNSACTQGYAATSTHSGSAENNGGSFFTYSVPDSLP